MRRERVHAMLRMARLGYYFLPEGRGQWWNSNRWCRKRQEFVQPQGHPLMDSLRDSREMRRSSLLKFPLQ
jgi:uncharacterized membrane-anchored protein